MNAVLVIAGSDSSGGAGLARDLRTLEHFRTPAVYALTAVTTQSDAQVLAVHALPPQIVSSQIRAAFATRAIGAVKIGMLANAANAHAVAAALADVPAVPMVLDPVLAASSGGELLDAPGREVLLRELLPRATLLTPNIPEAAALLGATPAHNLMARLEQGESLMALGARAVLLKGGHGLGDEVLDLLLEAGAPPRHYRVPRSPGSCRGTGCALASGIAAGLAAGAALADAYVRSHGYVLELLQAST